MTLLRSTLLHKYDNILPCSQSYEYTAILRIKSYSSYYSSLLRAATSFTHQPLTPQGQSQSYLSKTELNFERRIPW